MRLLHALDKAAHLLGIKLLKAPLSDKWVADIAWIRDHISENTVALVGSAANYAHGLVDPIIEDRLMGFTHG